MLEIPLLDLKKQYEMIKFEIEPAVLNVMRSSHYIMGREVEAFEAEIEEYLGCRYAVSCANGTDALVLALDALGITRGDEVITTPFTFFATAEAISRVGATPVFVDVLEDTYNIDPSKIEAKITGQTKAIMPVHIFGQPAQMEDIIQIAKRHDLYVIEDACQAMGAAYKGRKAGTMGDVGCFSFFPTKNLGGFGDGGLIVTDNEKLAKVIKALRTHGGGKVGEEAYKILSTAAEVKADPSPVSFKRSCSMDKYYNYMIGYNSRLDEIQAAILRVKLKWLDSWNTSRQQLAARYNEKLTASSLVTPVSISEVSSIYHLYVIQSEKRDELTAWLKEKGIATGVYYPVPLHLQKAYTGLEYRPGDMPAAEYLSKRTLALPVYPELTDEEQDYIISAIYEFERQ